ncbi:amino acid ABC transporter substrate-binding protein [Rhizobium halophytocola]|uniref:Glutamate/aspartate transport system substrate-binding protein n=1 Tax=Rhizobium halophytocola TaxID=735519 RepID=A0ABS4DV12_9HYPH|nr:amino acid ABC transporter substrate-binding protein [Rhizobium halophytocola]MBP1849537.1 glutamate/aspartate transport system substrate-binding protein [Rhizobium halophytocola]
MRHRNALITTVARSAPRPAFGLALSLLGLVTGAAVAGAAEDSPTLDKIASTGTVSIGYRMDASPFSYVDGAGHVIGYTTDLCRRVIDKIGERLGLDHIDVVEVPSTAATRFVLVKSGKVDLECTTTTNTAQRREQVAFSYPDFTTATRFVSRKSDNLDTIASLSGKSVSSTTGTVNIGQLNAKNLAENLNLSVMLAKSHAEGFGMVAENRASAFVMDGILLADLVASSDHPEDFTISNEAFGPVEPYGILMRKDDPVFKDTVNAALKEIYTSGEIHTIYAKWFLSPIPPDGRNLNLPETPDLAAAFANPQEYSE